MNQSIILALLSFTLGILATFFAQALSRHWRYSDGRRKRKNEHLQSIRELMESYHVLFNCKYPEFLELIFAHKMLSPQYPNYDKTISIKIYNALKEYRDTRAKHDEKVRKAYESLQSLSDKRLEGLLGLNLFVSLVLVKLRIGRGYLLPISFKDNITPHLKLISKYQYQVFDEFPKKAFRYIEWENLDHILPDDLFTIIHPWLKLYEGNEDKSEYREREIRMVDEMENLTYYRNEARREIDYILSEIRYQEEKWFVPNN